MRKNFKTKARVMALISALSITAFLNKDRIEKEVKMAKYSDFLYDNELDSFLGLNKEEELIKDISNYLDNNQHSTVYEKESFKIGFNYFIKVYGKYLNRKQINILLNTVEYSLTDYTNYDKIYYALNGVLEIDGEMGSGIKKAWISSHLKYDFGYDDENSYNNSYRIFYDITSTLGDEVNKYIFENDIEGLIASLTNAYNLEDDSIIREIIITFDSINKEGIDKEEESELYKKLQELTDDVYKNKLQVDPSFIMTVLGREAYNRIYEGKINVFVENDNIIYEIYDDFYGSLNVQKVNVNSTAVDLEELLEKEAKEIINENSYVNGFLSYIVSWNEFIKIQDEKSLDLLWDNLFPYFQDKNDMICFIIALKDLNPKGLEKYLEILTLRLTNNEISLETLAELNSSERFYNKIENTTLSLSYDIDKRKYFNKIKEAITESDFNIGDASNIYSVRDYQSGIKEYSPDEEIIIYSKEVNVEIDYINNQYYAYYKVPKEYQNSEGVIFKYGDIYEKVEGLMTNIYNKETGNFEQVLLVYLGIEGPDREFEPIVFKTTYKEFLNNQKQEKNSMLEKKPDYTD